MTELTRYREFVRSARSRVDYWKNYATLQFTVSLGRIMRADKVSGKKLSKLLGVSSQQVSKVLNGGENVTVETMAKFANALDAVVYIHVAKRGVEVRWLEGAEVGSVVTTSDSVSEAATVRMHAVPQEYSKLLEVHA